MRTTDIVTCVFALFTALAVKGQGTFQNLNFESANPISAGNPGNPYQVTFSSALPYWSGSIGGTPVSTVLLNSFDLGAASIDVFGPGWNSVNPGLLAGNYTLFLQSGAGPGGVGMLNTSISQNGTIPVGTGSLIFTTWSWPSVNSAFSVSFAGNDLSVFALSSGQLPSGQDYTEYGANLEGYAGQTGQLEFTSLFTGAPSWTEFDDITFSPNDVPEPSALGLILISVVAFAVRRWRPTA